MFLIHGKFQHLACGLYFNFTHVKKLTQLLAMWFPSKWTELMSFPLRMSFPRIFIFCPPHHWIFTSVPLLCVTRIICLLHAFWTCMDKTQSQRSHQASLRRPLGVKNFHVSFLNTGSQKTANSRPVVVSSVLGCHCFQTPWAGKSSCRAL